MPIRTLRNCPARGLGSAWSVAALMVLGFGVALRLLFYFENQSLFMDEIALGLNIVDRNIRQLTTEPLTYFQTAPAGFLLVQKLLVSLLGSNEFILRLLPLAASLLALPVFWKAACLALDRRGALIAAFLFAICVPLIFYGSQVKQYSLDVLISSGLTWLALMLVKARLTNLSLAVAFWSGVAGAVCAVFSQPAVFLLPGMGLALLASALWEPSAKPVLIVRVLVPLGVFWLTGVVGAGLLGLNANPPDARAYFLSFWDDGVALMPKNGTSAAMWPAVAVASQFGYFEYQLPITGGWRLPMLYFGVALLGLVLLLRRVPFVALVLVGPLLLTLAAAALQLYPFRMRLILFLTPVYLIFTSAGVSFLSALARRYLGKPGEVLLLGAALLAPVFALASNIPPKRIDDVRAALQYVSSHRRDGDSIYVYYGAVPGVSVYASRLGFREGDLYVGGCYPRASIRKYLAELDAFRGKERVWLVLTHAPRRDAMTIMQYLETIGRRRRYFSTGSVDDNNAAHAHLFDLSDDALLGKATPFTFKITEREFADARFAYACGGGPIAIGRRSDILSNGRLIE